MQRWQDAGVHHPKYIMLNMLAMYQEILEIPQSSARGLSQLTQFHSTPKCFQSCLDMACLKNNLKCTTSNLHEFRVSRSSRAKEWELDEVATLIGKSASTINALKTYSKLVAQTLELCFASEI